MYSYMVGLYSELFNAVISTLFSCFVLFFSMICYPYISLFFFSAIFVSALEYQDIVLEV